MRAAKFHFEILAFFFRLKLIPTLQTKLSRNLDVVSGHFVVRFFKIQKYFPDLIDNLK